MTGTDIRERWADAIYEAHPCDDYSCDIAVARRNGYLEYASWILRGATETPTLDAFESANGIVVTFDMALSEWRPFHREYGRKCTKCETYNYADEGEPTVCGDCLAPLPDSDDEDA